MSISTGGFAALLVVAGFALSSCGSSDHATITTTTVVSPPPATQTTTQSAQTTASAAPKTTHTTTPPAQTTTTKPAPAPVSTPAAPKPTPAPKATSACPRVDLGARDGDVAETFARIKDLNKISCETATIVVGQWGAQRIGTGKALLPLGWKCSGNACRNGSRSVSFVIEPPSEGA